MVVAATSTKRQFLLAKDRSEFQCDYEREVAMCANRQTADDAILYKPVVPRTIRLISARPGATRIGTEKPEQTRGFPFRTIRQFGWI